LEWVVVVACLTWVSWEVAFVATACFRVPFLAALPALAFLVEAFLADGFLAEVFFVEAFFFVGLLVLLLVLLLALLLVLLLLVLFLFVIGSQRLGVSSSDPICRRLPGGP